MSNENLKYPGEVPSPYGAKGKRAFEEHQRKVDTFFEDIEQMRDQSKQNNKEK